jgi:hypothetical protein
MCHELFAFLWAYDDDAESGRNDAFHDPLKPTALAKAYISSIR